MNKLGLVRYAPWAYKVGGIGAGVALSVFALSFITQRHRHPKNNSPLYILKSSVAGLLLALVMLGVGIGMIKHYENSIQDCTQSSINACLNERRERQGGYLASGSVLLLMGIAGTSIAGIFTIVSGSFIAHDVLKRRT